MKYKNRKMKYSETLGWIVLMPDKQTGFSEMHHFKTQEECRQFIDEQHRKEEENQCEYWYQKYLN